jgi:hypothetical protein
VTLREVISRLGEFGEDDTIYAGRRGPSRGRNRTGGWFDPA